MAFLFDVVADAARDTLALVPFLLATYLALEALEHAAGDRVNGLVRRAGLAGPVAGALLGAVPQCGFSAMGATLYAGRVATLGTLIAVFLSTSDEMLPMLVAEGISPALTGKIIGLKVLIALVTGVLVDLAVRVVRRARVGRKVGVRAAGDELLEGFAQAGAGAEHIHRLCERDRCGCDDIDAAPDRGVEDHRDRSHVDTDAHVHAHGHGGMRAIVRSALSHTVQVSAFIFLVSCVLTGVLEQMGEDAIMGYLSSYQGLAVVGAALVGLIPNCSASVVITQLYLEGILGFGPMMAGLLVSAGVGYLVLFRTNRRPLENAAIVVLLLAVAIFWGFVLGAWGV